MQTEFKNVKVVAKANGERDELPEYDCSYIKD